MRHGSLISVLGLLLGTGCGNGDGPPEGTEGGPCYGNGTCNADLTCSGSNICVLLADPCNGVTCSDNGNCVDNAGVPECDCDAGYSAVELECIEGDHMMSGAFTIENNPDIVNGNPSTDIYDPVEGAPIDYVVVFDIVSQETNDTMSSRRTLVTTGPATVIFSGDSSGTMDQLVVALEGESSAFALDTDKLSSETTLVFGLGDPAGGGTYAFEIVGGAPVTLDGQGYPVVEPFQITNGTATLRRFENLVMTDFATGSSTLSFE